MREYELVVVFDLAVAESGGADAAPDLVTTFVEARQGKVLKHDHWGRRRMAYPINRTIDADYVVSRVEIDPEAVTPLEAALRIDERVYRHLIVRADELPVPPPPREPRRMPVEQQEGVEAVGPAGRPPSAVAEGQSAVGDAAAEEPAPVAVAPEAVAVAEETAAVVEAVEAAEDAEDLAVEAFVEDEPASDAPMADNLTADGADEPETVAAAVESAATEADAATEAGTEDDEEPSA